MERRILIVCGMLLAVILVAILFGLVRDSYAARREALAADLGAIRPVEVSFDNPNWDFEKWQKTVAGKPALWQELIAPPPKPPPPPPPPPKPPDTKAMIKDVVATRSQMGPRAKIKTKTDPKGTFLGVGDQVNGMTIKEITKTTIVLSLTWQNQELTETLERNR